MIAAASSPVRVAAPDELHAIGRFRYAALSTDPDFQPSQEMLASEKLVDAWDPLSEVLIAGDAHEIHGTFRVLPLQRVARAHGTETVMRAFRHLGLERALEIFSLETITIVGRLAVAPSLRGTRTVVDLLAAGLSGCRTRGERLSLADCSPPLLRLYARLAGFFRSGPDYHDPVFGVKTPIMGTLGNHEALAGTAIGHVARAFPDDLEAREFRKQIALDVAKGEGATRVRNTG